MSKNLQFVVYSETFDRNIDDWGERKHIYTTDSLKEAVLLLNDVRKSCDDDTYASMLIYDEEGELLKDYIYLKQFLLVKDYLL